jgi:formyltetrahydrofolate deformylase
MTHPNFIIRGSCRDSAGIVSKITTCLFNHGMNIEEAAQFNDQFSEYFFFRIVFSSKSGTTPPAFLDEFLKIADSLDMSWSCNPCHEKVKTLLLVSKSDHCLNDILYRWQNKLLPIEIMGVISNHDNNRAQVESHGLPFHYFPISSTNRAEQETSIEKLIETTHAELVVLARYMQVLSVGMSDKYAGRIINIHHSFLPGFKGAKPYHQAYERGVKIIGATAHFVTSDLDEGPIIEQDVTRITHAHTPEKLQIIGQDIESRVLLTAMQYYSERRIFLHGSRTIIL